MKQSSILQLVSSYLYLVKIDIAVVRINNTLARIVAVLLCDTSFGSSSLSSGHQEALLAASQVTLRKLSGNIE